MYSRRKLILSAPALLAVAPGLAACSSRSETDGYDAVVRRTWQLGELQGFDNKTLPMELVRYATLTPSSHNTQCWKFRITERAIEVLPDLTRRCPAVDPDDHHLFVSLGCATENLIQAALAHGLNGDATFDNAADLIRVQLEPTKAHVSAMFQAIPERQCTRGEYDGQKLSGEELELLRKAGTDTGVQIIFLNEPAQMESALDYVIQGNTTQMNDKYAQQGDSQRLSESASRGLGDAN